MSSLPRVIATTTTTTKMEPMVLRLPSDLVLLPEHLELHQLQLLL
jgi:hypothetical protein